MAWNEQKFAAAAAHGKGGVWEADEQKGADEASEVRQQRTGTEHFEEARTPQNQAFTEFYV